MIRFILKRMLALAGVLLVLTAVLFLLRQLTPGDPAKQILGPNATEDALRAVRHDLWLDRPLPAQYVHYLDGLLHGDLQTSYRTQRPVADDLLQHLPATAELAALALLAAVVLGLLLGLASAARYRGASLLRWAMIAGASMPTFLLALLGILALFSWLGWLPASGRTAAFDAPTGPTRLLLLDSLLAGRLDVFGDALRHLVLPVLTVAVLPAVAIGRVLRSSLVSTLQTDYVRTARSKGLSELAILLRHAVRNSVGPALSMTGLQVGAMFAGLAVAEVIFAWPGIGAYVAASVPAGDFPGVAGVTLVIGAIYVVANAAVDVAQAAADPRIRI